ncbi:DMT family transporter [Azospirillum thermophilum]|uniref:EamA family transporter n=1 Tax=Azospirillum thermophilum TaxID=2202148 RepID=A0A2S2CN78_9PROT|nr:DMT family transporter [Azospirillum thermophilum]AWK85908.1 EamA family transporter [Azospirillum thermophilum]
MSAPADRSPSPAQAHPSGRRGIADQAWLLMLLPPLFWAGNAVVGRAVAGEVPPIGLAFWRWLVGALIVLPFAWRHLRVDLPVLARQWKGVLLLGTLGIGMYNTFQYIALNSTTALNVVMMQSVMPVLIVMVTFVLYGERVRPLQGLGIVVSLMGAGTLISHGDLQVLLNLRLNTGDLWMLLAVTVYAFYTALLRRRPGVHGLSLVVVTFLIGAVEQLPFYVWETMTRRAVEPTLVTAAAVGYVALFPSIVAYLCYNRAAVLVGPNTLGLTIHLIPVFGSILAILFLGEQPFLYHGAGIALIALGILLATRRRT